MTRFLYPKNKILILWKYQQYVSGTVQCDSTSFSIQEKPLALKIERMLPTVPHRFTGSRWKSWLDKIVWDKQVGMRRETWKLSHSAYHRLHWKPLNFHITIIYSICSPTIKPASKISKKILWLKFLGWLLLSGGRLNSSARTAHFVISTYG